MAEPTLPLVCFWVEGLVVYLNVGEYQVEEKNVFICFRTMRLRTNLTDWISIKLLCFALLCYPATLFSKQFPKLISKPGDVLVPFRATPSKHRFQVSLLVLC